MEQSQFTDCEELAMPMARDRELTLELLQTEAQKLLQVTSGSSPHSLIEAGQR